MELRRTRSFKIITIVFSIINLVYRSVIIIIHWIPLSRRFGPQWGPPSSYCGGLVAFGHLGGPFKPSQCCFVIRIGIFGGVSFLIFCDLRLISGFWILIGNF